MRYLAEVLPEARSPAAAHRISETGMGGAKCASVLFRLMKCSANDVIVAY